MLMGQMDIGIIEGRRMVLDHAATHDGSAGGIQGGPTTSPSIQK